MIPNEAISRVRFREIRTQKTAHAFGMTRLFCGGFRFVGTALVAALGVLS